VRGERLVAVDGGVRFPRRDSGLPGLLFLLALAAAVTALFAVTPLDIAAARIFYRPGALDPWPLARELPWSVLYRLAPWLTAALVVSGLGMLAFGGWRRQGIFLLLSVVIGPGLLVNAVFKDHWGRPRPRDVVEFGGPLHYRPAPLPGGEGGASFPCGHCSVGFLFAAGWWIWRRRRPARAWGSLALGLAAGFALGLGRMAAGGHFLSDVIWSALLALGVAHLVYHYALPVRAVRPEAIERPSSSRVQRWIVAGAALGGLGVLAAPFAAPHGTELAAEIPLTVSPRLFEVAARKASVEIAIVDAPADRVTIGGELHGFGLPGSRLEARSSLTSTPVPALSYRIEQHGWFTDLDGIVRARVPAGDLERIAVHVEHGNIRVTDATRAGVVRSGRIRLDLRTAAGRVRAPGATLR
jgi:lipid A 4'-phosphatase